jgi:hypothetical protein
MIRTWQVSNQSPVYTGANAADIQKVHQSYNQCLVEQLQSMFRLDQEGDAGRTIGIWISIMLQHFGKEAINFKCRFPST